LQEGEMSQEETSGRKEWWHTDRLFGMSSLKEGAFWHADSFLGNDSVNTFLQQWIHGNNLITSIAMQRAVNTIEEEVFSVWFANIHCWATDMFPMGCLEIT
jgi:hypothetical protein